MATTSIRVSKETHDQIKSLAEQQKKAMGDVIAEAIDHYREQRFWQDAQDAYGRLRNDPAAWAHYQDELREWDAVLMDGLENEAPYPQGAPIDES